MLQLATVKDSYGDFSSRATWNAPETRLMLAVLQDALIVFYRGLDTRDSEAIEAFREVDYWFRDRDFDNVFSFENICSALGISAGCVRDNLNDARRVVLGTGVAFARRPPSRLLR
jgi:hypothetical protein